MSIQTTSAAGRPRAVRTRERWLRLRRITRLVAELRHRLTSRPQRFAAGAAYVAELLGPRQPRVEHLDGASIGYYQPPTLVALRLGDEVRISVFGELYHDATGYIERFVPTKARPIGVRTPAAIGATAIGEATGIVWFAADELVLIGRPAARTLTMEAVLADAGSGRAW